jgi:hypothetical protein
MGNPKPKKNPKIQKIHNPNQKKSKNPKSKPKKYQNPIFFFLLFKIDIQLI